MNHSKAHNTIKPEDNLVAVRKPAVMQQCKMDLGALREQELIFPLFCQHEFFSWVTPAIVLRQGHVGHSPWSAPLPPKGLRERAARSGAGGAGQPMLSVLMVAAEPTVTFPASYLPTLPMKWSSKASWHQLWLLWS